MNATTGSSYPLMDTLNSAMFRLSLEDLVDLERKRRTGMSRNEILANVYCPASSTTSSFEVGGGTSGEARLASATAVCIEGSRAALALSWSNHGSRNVEARRQEALRSAIEKSASSSMSAMSSRPGETSVYHFGSTTSMGRCERSEHKNFVVVNHGFPIDPDYNIFTHSLHSNHSSSRESVLNKSISHPSPSRLTYGDPSVVKHDCSTPSPEDIPAMSKKRSRPKTSVVNSAKVAPMISNETKDVQAIVTPGRGRRGRRLKLFRKRTFLVNDSHENFNKSNHDSDDGHRGGKENSLNSKLRIVQFDEETTLTKASTRKAASVPNGHVSGKQQPPQQQRPSRVSVVDQSDLSSNHLPLAVSPRFNWKDVETSQSGSNVGEEQLTRQLIALHRAITHKDKTALGFLARQGIDMTLPLRGVTALSLSLYLKHSEMTVELLTWLKKTRQIGRAIDQPSVDNASRREPPLVTASRTGLMEAATLLLTHGASTEARDGQGRTALWHAVREEQDGIVEMLIHAGARVFHENEDLSCPTQLACKTALLKNRGRQMVKLLICHGANLEFVDHALRNALYWSVYNCCGETTAFLIDCGARMRPWSWISDDALPASFLQDPVVYSKIASARRNPYPLTVIARCRVRLNLSRASGGRSILPLIQALHVEADIKDILSLEIQPRGLGDYPSSSSQDSPRRRLKKLCSETKV